MKINKYSTDKGILIEEADEFADSPRENDCIFTKFYTFSRNHNSPDSHNFGSFVDFLGGYLSSQMFKKVDAAYRENKYDEANEILISYMKKKGYVLLPVWKYEHSGISYRAAEKNPYSCPFDSCMVGVIFCNKKDIANNFNRSVLCASLVKDVNKMMQEEVEEYNCWVNGEVYYYFIQEENEEEPEGLGTYYGSIEENGILEYLGITKYEPVN